jgi:hypothetical protein
VCPLIAGVSLCAGPLDVFVVGESTSRGCVGSTHEVLWVSYDVGMSWLVKLLEDQCMWRAEKARFGLFVFGGGGEELLSSLMCHD